MACKSNTPLPCTQKTKFLCLSQFPLGTSPRATPGDSLKKTCPGVGIWFSKVAKGRESTGAGIMWKMKLKLQKYSVDKFLQVKTKKNKRKKVEFFTFSRFTCFLNGIFPGLLVNFLFYCHTYLTKKSEELPLACLFKVFTWLWLSTPTFA